MALIRQKCLLKLFRLLPIKTVPITEDLVFQASEIKAEFSIPYCDCFAIATSIKKNGIIITGDPDFKKVEKVVKVEWIK
ncbi:TPA: hypothetical protein DCX16_04110 [bacterium]|nr:hypothetical protein [bacterium]